MTHSDEKLKPCLFCGDTDYHTPTEVALCSVKLQLTEAKAEIVILEDNLAYEKGENSELEDELAEAQRANLRQRVEDACHWIDYEVHLGGAICQILDRDNFDGLVDQLFKDKSTIMDWLIERGVSE